MATNTTAMPYPNHWVSYKWILWDLQDFAEKDIFEYSYFDSFALTPLTPTPSTPFKFGVRCRYRIYNESQIPIFSSLLEVEFILQSWEVNIEKLKEYAQEARDLYAEEYKIKTMDTVLENEAIRFAQFANNLDPLNQLLDGYK